MKIKLFNTALFRVSQFPTNAELKDCWPALKLSIKDASSYFYNIIHDLDYDEIENQPKNIKNTITKYFNRARFRATPYGTFASVGTLQLSDQASSRITISSEAKVHNFIDWSYIKESEYSWKESDFDKLAFQTNTTYYESSGMIRYLYYNEGKFELSELPGYPEVFHLLEVFKEAKMFSVSIPYPAKYELSTEEWRDLAKELIDLQLIFTNKHPGIIGTHQTLKKISPEDANKSYKIAVRQTIDGELSKDRIQALSDAIAYLNKKRLQKSNTTELDNFIQQYTQKYDQQEVPLMEALDPVIGIGYGNYATTDNSNDLLQGLINAKMDGLNPVDTSQTQLISFLQTKTRLNTIQLEELNLPDHSDDRRMLPNTFSALIKISGNSIQVNHIGSATANALLGRFTLADNQVKDQCRALAAIEQQANPGILFFDVAYSGEPNVDNINRRLPIYEETLAIHNYADGSVIDIQDVFLKVKGSELILYSRKKRKRLIPRIASAYNYSRSDLPLFRLLCDVQNQGIVNSLKPDLHNILQGQDYTPRLQYKEVILSLRSWLLKYDQVFEQPSFFRNYLRKNNIDRYLQVGTGDQTLRIDTNSLVDRQLLVSILKLRKELWTEEYLHNDQEIIQDEQGNPFTSEMVLSYHHDTPVYTMFPNPVMQLTDQRTFFPGSEWLYFEIYAHTQILDRLLTDAIHAIVELLQDKVKGWFFIRYNEGGEHIRLRFQPVYKKDIGDLINIVFQAFDEYQNTGLIRDIKICTYKRELERYAYAGMEGVEHHFCLDSNLVLQLLKNGYSTTELYKLIITYTLELGTLHFGIHRFTALLQQIKSSYAKEHKIQKKHYKQINKSYESWNSQTTITTLPKEISKLLRLFQDSFRILLENVDPSNDSILFGDLFHMHVNRIFTDHQRTHEYIIYEYLYKLCISLKYERTIKI